MIYNELESIGQYWEGEICIWGAGQIGTGNAYDLLIAAGIKIDFYIDNKYSEGEIIRDGIKVKKCVYLYENRDNIFTFVCVGKKLQKEIVNELIKNGVSHYTIIGSEEVMMCLDSIDKADDKIKEKYRNIYDDSIFLKKQFKKKAGYELNLDNPKSFNEKLQWLKINNHNPKYTQMVDKVAFKEYIAKEIGSEFVFPTLGVWEKYEDIDFDKLPDKFVLKCNHDSGSIVVVEDKNKIDYVAVKDKLTSRLNVNYYWASREWPYKNIQRKIIAEPYLVDETGTELKDYKLFCFNGKVRMIQVDYDRFVEHKRTLYDTDWNRQNFTLGFPTDKSVEIDKPDELEEMIQLAERFSEGIPHVRVDLYIINHQVFFGEFTFFHGGGYEKFTPDIWDYTLGDMIILPERIT